MTETASHNQLTRKETPQVTVRTLLAITTTVAILVGVASLFHSHSKPYDQHVGMWVNPFAACIAIYFWRFRISQLPSRRMRVAMFSILVALTLPFIYWTGALLADWSRISVSKWLGDPVWVYTVPFFRFLHSTCETTVAIDAASLSFQLLNCLLRFQHGRSSACFGRRTSTGFKWARSSLCT